MALHSDDALDLMRLAGQINLRPGRVYTTTEVCLLAHCTPGDGEALLRFLCYLGHVERRQTRKSEPVYQLSDHAPDWSAPRPQTIVKRAG